MSEAHKNAIKDYKFKGSELEDDKKFLEDQIQKERVASHKIK